MRDCTGVRSQRRGWWETYHVLQAEEGTSCLDLAQLLLGIFVAVWEAPRQLAGDPVGVCGRWGGDLATAAHHHRR